MADTNSRTAPGSNGAEGETARHRDATASEIRTRGPVSFGKYELLKRIRVGGMAEVFRARELARPDALLAIKRILPSFTDEADYVSMFIDEAQLGARLQHRCIAATVELGRVEDEFYLALEYVDGLDAGVLLRRARSRSEPLPVAIACLIARELCAALEYAHDLCDEQGAPLGIVHRDVSPQNILVSFDGDVKLIDFGIAKSTEQRMRTAAGLLKGKYGYLSPEQAQGQEVDRRSDLFSLGVCLYEMLSAQRLFLGSSDFSTIGRVRRAEIPPLRTFAPDVPDELIAIVERVLAADCTQRYQTAGELGAALDAFVERSGQHCERAALGEFVRTAAADAQADGLGDADTADGDPGTDLLDAFDDVEPVSAVSVLAEPPAPRSLDASDAPDASDASDDEDLYDTMRDEVLAEPENEQASREPGEAPVAPRSRGDATGEDLLEELSVDEPTHVVPYESATSGGEQPGDAAQGEATAEPPDDGAPAAEQVADSPSDAEAGGIAPQAAPPPAAAGNVVHATTLPGIGMEWDDEELSTQLYDPPEPGQVGPRAVAGSLALPRSAPPPVAPFVPAPSFPPGPLSAAEVLAQAAGGGLATAARSLSGRPASEGGLVPASAAHSTAPPSARAPLLPRTGLAVWAIAGILALAAVGVPLALWATRVPDRGMINLTTSPADALVKLDGERAGVSTSPFVLSNVTPEVAHLIEVSKPGYRAWSAKLKLAPGQVVDLPHVELTPSPGTAAPAMPMAAEPAPRPATTIVPSGAGAPRDEPAAGSADGEHTLPVQRVSADPERPRPRPAPLAGPRARPSPAPAPGPAAGGIAPALRGGATSMPRAAQPEPTAESAPVPREPLQAAPQPARDGAPGILRINSRPWSRVYVDGRLIGTTPQMKITLGAGLHTVTLVNPDFGLQQVFSVQIAPGETITKIVELSP